MKIIIDTDTIMSKVNSDNNQSGFTLIELMVTVSIVAIIASIAVPSYSKYALTNLESQTIVEIKTLEIQLEKWKASRLTYKGFIPSRGPGVCPDDITEVDGADDVTATVAFCFDETNNTTIYVPKGSTSTNYVYKIELLDKAAGSTLVNGGTDITLGRDWYVFAEPKSTGPAKNGFRFLLTSSGVQCKTKDVATTKASTDCTTHSTTELW